MRKGCYRSSQCELMGLGKFSNTSRGRPASPGSSLEPEAWTPAISQRRSPEHDPHAHFSHPVSFCRLFYFLYTCLLLNGFLL